jgi:murein DD-endopeptidase MepM/ murein hydrolase activator NlpD
MIIPSYPGGKTRTLRLHSRHLRGLGSTAMLAIVLLLGWNFVDSRQATVTADQLADVQRLVMTLSDSLHVSQVRTDSALRVAAAATAAKQVAVKHTPTLMERVAARGRRDDSGLAAPLPGVVLPVIGEITSRFSRSRLHPLLNIFRPHLGVDLSAPRGTNITAPAAGRVTNVARSFNDGLMVELNHGGGVVTRYAHCQKVLVKTGDEVLPGAVIATVGSSGLATGPHVHFEVVVNGRPVDPFSYLLTAHNAAPVANADRAGGGPEPRDQ